VQTTYPEAYPALKAQQEALPIANVFPTPRDTSLIRCAKALNRAVNAQHFGPVSDLGKFSVPLDRLGPFQNGGTFGPLISLFTDCVKDALDV
jgi:hypothetical protein